MYYLCYAILPFYDDHGYNATYTLLSDGTKETYQLPIKTYIYRMFHQLYMDPLALKNWSTHILSSQYNLPLIINETYIFIPVKMRTPIGRCDGACGYVLLSAIKDFKDGTITLVNGTTLDTLSSDTYLTKKMKDARLLRYAYEEHRKPFEFIHPL